MANIDELAERVCLLVGWTGVRHETDRDAAVMEAWREWAEAMEAAGRPTGRRDDLSDADIRELAGRYRDRRAATLAQIDQIVSTE